MRKTRRKITSGFRGKKSSMRGRNMPITRKATGGPVRGRKSPILRGRKSPMRGKSAGRRNFQSGGSALGRGRSRNTRMARGGSTRGRRFQSGGYNTGRRRFQSGGQGNTVSSGGWGSGASGGAGLGYRKPGPWETGRNWTLDNLTGGTNKASSFSGWTLKNPPGADRGQVPPGPEALNRSILSKNPKNPVGPNRFDTNDRTGW